MNTPDARSILEATANQILAVVAPHAARLVRATVTLDETAETAATDGVRIWVPPLFEGVDVTHELPVAVGLLVHELGHFLQPLKALEEVEERTGCPHWLANIIMDIQLEAMMASLFPPLAGTLIAVRTTVKAARAREYETAIAAAPDFRAGANALALLGRFGRPDTAFDEPAHRGSSGPVWRVIRGLPADLGLRAEEFLGGLAEALTTAPDGLGELIEALMDRFPELRQAPAAFAVPGGGLDVGGLGAALQGEAQGNVGNYTPGPVEPLQTIQAATLAAHPDAQRAARGLRLHFQAARGATEIVAPQRLDRRAAALDEPAPFRMTLPGRELPAPRLVICLDKSGSMKGAKFALASRAAQAVALAVKEAQGEVVGVLFDDAGYIAAGPILDRPLYVDPAGLSYGGTDFEFLLQVWRRWPAHQVLLVTDGDGCIPTALPGDKARTAAIVIPPDCDLDLMRQLADRVVTLTDLRSLANIMALLTPRNR